MFVTVTGADDVIRDYARGKKAIQSKTGLVTREAAMMLQRKIQEIIEWMNIPDTGTLYRSIIAKKVASYNYIVGDLDYPEGVLPYGVFIEKGVLRRHFVPREYFFATGKEGSIPQQRIMELDNVREKHGRPEVTGLMVGPMPPRPYHTVAVELSKPDIEQFFKDEIEQILPDFQGNLIIK